jgi:hypothetical protein
LNGPTQDGASSWRPPRDDVPREHWGALGRFATRHAELDLALRQCETTVSADIVRDLLWLSREVVDVLDALQASGVNGHDDAWGVEERPTQVGDRSEPQPPRLEDVCFMGAIELSRAARGLAQAAEGGPGSWTAVAESLHRKVGRVLFAAAHSVPAHTGPGESVTSLLRCQVENAVGDAVSVRRLYARFRRSLRQPAQENGVLSALRYAAGALAELMASPCYRAIRLTDRALLCRQRERLLNWGRGPQLAPEGWELVADLQTSSALLRDINRRQGLRTHDRALLRRLIHGPRGELVDWVASFAALEGLDDELDELVDRLRQTGDETAIAAVASRLRQLLTSV